MKRVFIERIVIDEGCLDLRDAESFCERLQYELSRLLETSNQPEEIDSTARVDGGELPAERGSVSPRMVAEHVVRSLGGNRSPCL
jgi:hypothetical protein